jgi:hypothetical protein
MRTRRCGREGLSAATQERQHQEHDNQSAMHRGLLTADKNHWMTKRASLLYLCGSSLIRLIAKSVIQNPQAQLLRRADASGVRTGVGFVGWLLRYLMISSSLSFRYLSKVFSSAMSCFWKASHDSSEIGSFARRTCSLSFPASTEKARNAFSKSQTNLARKVSSTFSTKLTFTSLSQFAGVPDRTGGRTPSFSFLGEQISGGSKGCDLAP